MNSNFSYLNETISFNKGFFWDIKQNFNDRDIVSYLLEEDEISDNVYFTDWFEFVKNARKVQAEKRYFFIKNISLIQNNYTILLIFKKTLINFILYSGNFKKTNINIGNFNNKSRFFSLLGYYLNLNYSKIKRLKDKNYYSNSENLIIILDVRHTKSKMFVLSKNKCLFNVTSGLIFKKLNLEKKKIKKTEKMFNLMLKTVYLKIQKMMVFKNCIIHIKGTRSNLFNVLVTINKTFKNKKISLLYAPHISYGKFKFKKIKSIKKRLRKKFTKLIKK